jgi:hypothetical protein
MIDVAVPEEVDALRGVVDDLERELERIGVVEEALALDGVGGVDVALPGLSLSTEHVGEGLAVVTATGGTFDATFDPATFPLSEAIRELIGDTAVRRVSPALTGPDREVKLATVSREGRWYVSLGFTIAEYVRAAVELDRPAAPSVTPAGHASPEAAAAAFYERLAALDVAGALTTLAPGEGDALLRYSSLFLPELDAALGDARDNGFALSLTGLELQRSGTDDRPTLTPSAFVVEGMAPSSWGFVAFGADPTVPTVIITHDGRYAVLPPGTPLPATLDGLELLDELPEDVLADRYNSTVADEQGSVMPIDFALPDGASPRPFRIERREGCTTFSGAGIESLFPGLQHWAESAADSAASPVVGGFELCAPLDMLGTSLLSLLLTEIPPVSLPPLSTVEVDGAWYVSPIGTIGAGLLEGLRAVPDGANLLDTPVSGILFGTTRASLDATLTAIGTVPSECEAVVTSADGTAIVVADPAPSAIRPCLEALWDANIDVGDGWGPAPTVEFEEAPTATVAG